MALRLHPTGPLLGQEVPLAEGVPGEIERKVLLAERADLDELRRTSADSRYGGIRRPLRFPARELYLGFDDRENALELRFALPKGCFATALLGEVMKRSRPILDRESLMRLFAIGDLHLPGGPQNKTMDRFGDVWIDHVDRVRSHWIELNRDDEDTLLVVGDLSWAMKLEEAEEDLRWLKSLPGRVVVIRGNHDFWWSGIGKVRRALEPEVSALQHSHVIIDSVAIVGTRGWQCPGSVGSADAMVDDGDSDAGTFRYTEQDEKIYRREVERLRLGLTNLKRAGAAYDRLVVALHYPPMNPEHEPSGFTELLDEHEVDLCVHGHLHGAASHATAFEGQRNATTYHCVSADAVQMIPRQLI